MNHELDVAIPAALGGVPEPADIGGYNSGYWHPDEDDTWSRQFDVRTWVIGGAPRIVVCGAQIANIIDGRVTDVYVSADHWKMYTDIRGPLTAERAVEVARGLAEAAQELAARTRQSARTRLRVV